MKKIILTALSVVLMVTCLLFNPSFDGVVKAGAGNGKNEKVESAEELVTILSYLSYPTGKARSTEEKEKPFESATVTIKTYLDSSSSSSNPKYSGGIKSTTQKLDRELVLYITEKTTYYKSKGIYKKTTEKNYYESTADYDAVKETRTFSETMDFDMEMLVYESEFYVKIKKMTVVSNYESRQIKKEYQDKWVKMSQDFVDSILNVDSNNRNVLNSFGEMLEYLIESDTVENDEKVISIDENDFAKLYEELEGVEPDAKGLELDFTYDLSDSTAPIITSYSKTERSDSQKIGLDDENIVSYDIKNNSEFSIKNINNTEVKFDLDKVELEADTNEEFDKLFVIEEREEEDDE